MPATGILRMSVTRGLGPRGYAPPSAALPTRVMAVWAVPDEARLAAINARVCHLRLGHQPALAGIKHLNRLENVMARAEWQDPEIQEGILLDQAGQVICGVMSNVFVWKDDTLLTPRLDACGVAGVTRARLMSVARQAGLVVAEARLDLDDLFAADEIMFTSSAILMWRVARLDERVWHKPAISPTLWKLLNA